jgi:hypothetical protein
MKRILITLAALALLSGLAYAGIGASTYSDSYEICLEECLNTCEANRIPPSQCDCRHCNVHRVVEEDNYGNR